MGISEEARVDQEVDRRTLIRRAAVLGAATAWAVPTVQSIAGPAFATGSPAGICEACLTGGGNIEGGTLNGIELREVSYGLGRICCDGTLDPEMSVSAHQLSGGGSATHWIFKENLQITCTKTGNPAPPPATAECPNRFTGSATTVPDKKTGLFSTVNFVFEDFGEPGVLDTVSFTITGPEGNLFVSGTRDAGNLQVHKYKKDCNGC